MENLYDYINTPELKALYGDFREGNKLNFAQYYNEIDANQFNIKDKQKNYLLNKDINFYVKKNKYIASSKHIYGYRQEDVDDEGVRFLHHGRYICVRTVDYELPTDNAVSVYPYIRLEIMGDKTLVAMIPNQGNWNIDFYVNERGELCVNTDNE